MADPAVFALGLLLIRLVPELNRRVSWLVLRLRLFQIVLVSGHQQIQFRFCRDRKLGKWLQYHPAFQLLTSMAELFLFLFNQVRG
jgi:hypothetical protein